MGSFTDIFYTEKNELLSLRKTAQGLANNKFISTHKILIRNKLCNFSDRHSLVQPLGERRVSKDQFHRLIRSTKFMQINYACLKQIVAIYYIIDVLELSA